VQKLSIKKTVLLEKMVILFLELGAMYICLFAAKVFARDRQTVIFYFIKNMNGIKKHERILKELK
jgi:hypothetical protein